MVHKVLHDGAPVHFWALSLHCPHYSAPDTVAFLLFLRNIKRIMVCMSAVTWFAFVVVQLLSPIWFFVTPWTAAHQASLSFTVFQSLLNLMSIKLVMPSHHLILCRPLLFLSSIFPSIRIFSNESARGIRWPKYWRLSLGISPSREYSGLISFRMDWFDLLAVQRTLKTLLQHHSSKHQFFSAQTSLRSSSHIHIWLLEKP